MKYYAADNSYSDSTSIGFSNTWSVLVFNSRKARDAYVSDSPRLATRSIRKNEVTNYAANWLPNDNRLNEPKPFTGEFWGIVDNGYLYDDEPDGYLGHVAVCDPYDHHNISRLFK
jgi:SRSO17 transposase